MDLHFTPFRQLIEPRLVPNQLVLMEREPHPLCKLATADLQQYLTHQQDWDHNFGLAENADNGITIGKMFGVLVVENEARNIGYLAAFSGKLAGSNHHSKFVPPVYDMLTDGSFLNIGMQELRRMNHELKALNRANLSTDVKAQITLLKSQRKQKSVTLQQELFNHYHFLNASGVSKNIVGLFKDAGYKHPPSGAGECAGPKLLQYAFLHQMKPLALAEFWWGQSPKSSQWKHQHFYPCCREKCSPILAHMLGEYN